MDMFSSKSERDQATEDARKAAEKAVEQLKSPSLNTVITYLRMLSENEMIRCSAQDDATIMRRSQGKVTAYGGVVALLEYEPVEFQASVVNV